MQRLKLGMTDGCSDDERKLKQQSVEKSKGKIGSRGIFKELRSLNLTVSVLRYLPLAKLVRQISRLSRNARKLIFSSLIWQEIAINDELTEFLPSFKSIANFINKSLTDYDYLHVLDLSRVFIILSDGQTRPEK